MKLKKVIDRFGTECVIDEDTKSLYDYDNKKHIVMYTAQVVENGELINDWATYTEDGTVNTVEERVTRFQNQLYAVYAAFVKYDRKKNDPDGNIYKAFVEEVKKKESMFFTECGNFKNEDPIKMSVFDVFRSKQ